MKHKGGGAISSLYLWVRCPNGLDRPPGTRYLVCIICYSQILTSQNQVQSNIYLKQQKQLLLIHTSLDRRLVNAELPWTEREVSGSSPKLWRQKSNNKPWLGDKRENSAKPQGSWHRSPKKHSPRDRGADLGPAKVSSTPRPWPGHFPVLNSPSKNLTSSNSPIANRKN